MSATKIRSIQNIWRYTAYPLKIFGLSANVVVPALVVLMFHWSWFTLGLFVISVAVLRVLEHFQFTPKVAWYAIRSAISGPVVMRYRHLGHRRLGK